MDHLGQLNVTATPGLGSMATCMAGEVWLNLMNMGLLAASSVELAAVVYNPPIKVTSIQQWMKAQGMLLNSTAAHCRYVCMGLGQHTWLVMCVIKFKQLMKK